MILHKHLSFILSYRINLYMGREIRFYMLGITYKSLQEFFDFIYRI